MCKIILPLLTILVSYTAYIVLDGFGKFDDLQPKGDFDCEYYEDDIIGPENPIQYTEDILITGSADFYKLFAGKFPLFGPHNTPSGALYAIYTKTKTTKQIPLLDYPKNVKFLPHGIDYDHEKKILSVINHAFQYGNERVERFQIIEQDGSLSAKLISFSYPPDQLNGILNDLIFISDNEYLTTQYLPYPDPLFGRQSQWLISILKSQLEVIFLKRDLTYIHHCKFVAGFPSVCTKLENTASRMVNGISWNRRQQVLVADTLGKQIKQYVIDPKAPNKQNLLKLQQIIPSQGLPDNIEYDRFRNQYVIGGIAASLDHVQFTELYKKNNTLPQNQPFPAIVQKINEHTLTIETVMLKEYAINGCSNAIQISNDEYILGSWVDRTVVVCKASKK